MDHNTSIKPTYRPITPFVISQHLFSSYVFNHSFNSEIKIVQNGSSWDSLAIKAIKSSLQLCLLNVNLYLKKKKFSLSSDKMLRYKNNPFLSAGINKLGLFYVKYNSKSLFYKFWYWIPQNLFNNQVNNSSFNEIAFWTKRKISFIIKNIPVVTKSKSILKSFLSKMTSIVNIIKLEISSINLKKRVLFLFSTRWKKRFNRSWWENNIVF